ncbi:hypothetical protein CCHR01_07843 [Colletotrichum chrysophilum]|uniref:Uncharacterized protein n=1 Tax=Colletotrichum chrysophilum TaxID=1836956 RepID=A0AAD9EIF6_9PEZI|nr:hypothetical protein CCHR01_07843 [Colletotrichum chrysophilum]
MFDELRDPKAIEAMSGSWAVRFPHDSSGLDPNGRELPVALSTMTSWAPPPIPSLHHQRPRLLRAKERHPESQGLRRIIRHGRATGEGRSTSTTASSTTSPRRGGQDKLGTGSGEGGDNGSSWDCVVVVSSEAFGGLLVFTLRKGRKQSLTHSGFIQQLRPSVTSEGQEEASRQKASSRSKGQEVRADMETGVGACPVRTFPQLLCIKDADICFPQKVQSWGQELPLPLSLPLLDPASICACQSVVKPGTTEESSRPSVKPSSNSNTSGISTQPFIIVVRAPVSPTRSLRPSIVSHSLVSISTPNLRRYSAPVLDFVLLSPVIQLSPRTNDLQIACPHPRFYHEV